MITGTLNCDFLINQDHLPSHVLGAKTICDLAHARCYFFRGRRQLDVSLSSEK